jgi:hypothetical protein
MSWGALAMEWTAPVAAQGVHAPALAAARS